MENLMTKIMLKTLLVLAAFGLYMLPAHADQIFVCQSCTTAPGTDPNPITNTGSFNVGVAGSATLESPLLIIVGTYNGGGSPSIVGATTPTIGTYGLTATTASFTSGDAFAALGLSSGGSENFGNWSGADTGAGLAAPTSFTLTAFAIDTELTSTPISVDLSGAPVGSFIIAYSCKDDSGCDTEGDVAQTVFTNTGFVTGPPTSTPEPSSLGLLGLGALGLVAFTVRRRPAANLI